MKCSGSLRVDDGVERGSITAVNGFMLFRTHTAIQKPRFQKKKVMQLRKSNAKKNSNAKKYAMQKMQRQIFRKVLCNYVYLSVCGLHSDPPPKQLPRNLISETVKD